jgi:thymidine kinase
MQQGHIHLIIGPMWAGKSSEMFRQIRRAVFAGKQPLVLRFTGDTRYTRSQMASSHDEEQMRALTTTDLLDSVILERAKQADIIGIDEGQFMENLVPFCTQMAKQGKHVVVAALDSDFRQDPFEQIAQLIPRAEYVTKLHAICVMCQGVASFSRRLGTNQDVLDIGGADKYVSTCRHCFSVPIQDEVLQKHKEALELVRELRKSPEPYT